MSSITIKNALKWGFNQLSKAEINPAELDAEILLLHALKSHSEFISESNKILNQVQDDKRINRAWLYTHLDNNIPKQVYKMFKSLIARRIQGEPTAYIINKKEFYGLDFYVDKRVLIPRSETEILVELALNELRIMNHELRNNLIIDLGTGSGCIIISLLKTLNSNFQPVCRQGRLPASSFQSFAIDISSQALEVAKLNAQSHGLSNQIKFVQGDLLKPIIESGIMNYESRILITSNLPYLSKNEYINSCQKNGLVFEPKNSLLAGNTGLELYEKLFKQIYNLINKQIIKESNNQTITLIIEHASNQTQQLQKLTKELLLGTSIVTKKDLAGLDRITILRSD